MSIRNNFLGGVKGQLLCNGHRVFIGDNGRVLDRKSPDDYTTL